MPSRTKTVGVARTDVRVQNDGGELDDAAGPEDVPAQNQHASMPDSRDRECEPGAQQCQGNAALTCATSGLWNEPAACSSSQRCTDGRCFEFPSCRNSGPGVDDCGDGNSCCESSLVPGGSFYRAYISSETGQATQLDAPADVSSFRLDKYEVTVGRFRQFVAARRSGVGFAPELGSGRHEHLNEGRGLRVVGGAYEPGWTVTDTDNLALTDINLSCDPRAANWTPNPAESESLAMNCVRWAEAQAFCIWDGGFLPSEAEWEYAAAGGDQQRKYPWGATAPGVSNEYAIYGCLYPAGPLIPGTAAGVCNGGNLPPVGTARLGVARWGQLDLGGGVWEWTIDSSPTDSLAQSYLALCTDCVDLTPAPQRLVRGGQYENSDYTMQPTFRKLANYSDRYPGVGFRCARRP